MVFTNFPRRLLASLRSARETIAAIIPGFAFAGLIAIAARYLSEHYGGPAMLFALLLGMAFNFLADGPKVGPGIKFSTKTVLRVGVALLGVRITWTEIGNLGAGTLLIIVLSVGLTILLGGLFAQAFGLKRDHAFLSAGAVAICGASAALAIAAVLPKNEHSERNTILTVIGVTTLSTVAMMLYPLIVGVLEFDDRAAGIFLGGTIHDVAQVVGAGYTISDEAGETAAIVKLLRVTCLTPAVLIIGLAFREKNKTETGATPLLPGFLVAFLVLVIFNSFGLIPDKLRIILSTASQWGLLTAVAALGVRTSLQELTSVGMKPLLALGAQTIFLAMLVLLALQFVLT